MRLRAYEPTIAAEVILYGDRSAVLSEGFQLIAGYIFGANKPRAKIDMTGPVEHQGTQKIAIGAGRSAGRWRRLDCAA